MALSIKLSPQAEKDLIGIWRYTNNQWHEAQANGYLDQLNTGIAQISEHPLIGLDYSHVRVGYRKFRIAQHNIFYRAGDTELTVIRALHIAMDAESRLK